YAAGATTGTFNDDLVGVSPGTSVVGFYPPGAITDGLNAIYAIGYNNTPAVPLAAESALTTAYNTFAGVAATTVFPGGQDLSQASVPGHPIGTLPPGVYKSASTVGIFAGNLTLDGGGNPQSVFVFQAGSTLTTVLDGAAGGNINLINGATACNVYWQVGSSAVLGGATFYGNVLALASVTLTSATQFTGRALASTGAVTISTASLITDPGGK
ncbi:MAG: ice-binding family protein, partial [Candidatus Lustribacter sp.]